MNGINKAILVGHLGGDPEIRKTQSGAAVASFSLATGESWKDKATGERRERTQWHRVVIFNEALCKIAEQYLKKGAKVYVEGSIQTRKYTDKDGVEKSITEIVLNAFNATITLLDRVERAPPPDENSYGESKPAGASRTAAAAKPNIDDEIPF